MTFLGCKPGEVPRDHVPGLGVQTLHCSWFLVGQEAEFKS